MSLSFFAFLPVGRGAFGSTFTGILWTWLTTASVFLLLMSEATASRSSVENPSALSSLRCRTLSSWTQAYFSESKSDMWSLSISFSILPVSSLSALHSRTTTLLVIWATKVARCRASMALSPWTLVTLLPSWVPIVE